jgi:hypothetical protein
MEANKAYFMVRAEVPNESDRAKFDQWYGTHHLPLAMDKFRAEKGWRFWSRSDRRSTMRFISSATWRLCATVLSLLPLSCSLQISIRHGRGWRAVAT